MLSAGAGIKNFGFRVREKAAFLRETAENGCFSAIFSAEFWLLLSCSLSSVGFYDTIYKIEKNGKESDMRIGTIELAGRAMLAPMAGVTDRAFRQVCREHGAAFSVTEMVSAKAMWFRDKKSPRLLALADNERPAAAQIFGSDPETMAWGAQRAIELSGCAVIDINMGCPAPKIVNNGDGSALMRDPALAGRIIEAVKKAVPVPVTVKFRLGWDENSKNYLEFARVAEQSGADAMTVHGRTRSQQYEGRADWDAIAEVKARAAIPVIANGDAASPEAAKALLDTTSADAVMIGRGALGDPWIFERTNAVLEGKTPPPLPPLEKRLKTAVRQIELAAQDKGEHIAMLEARKHVNWYLKGTSGLKMYKVRVSQLSRLEELYELAEESAAAAQGEWCYAPA